MSAANCTNPSGDNVKRGFAPVLFAYWIPAFAGMAGKKSKNWGRAETFAGGGNTSALPLFSGSSWTVLGPETRRDEYCGCFILHVGGMPDSGVIHHVLATRQGDRGDRPIRFLLMKRH